MRIIKPKRNYRASSVVFRIAIFCVAQLNRIFKVIPYKNSEKIVIISLHKIGDTIFTFPTIKFFRKKFDRNLTIVCYKSSFELYKLLDFEANIISVNDDDFHFGGRIAGLNSRKTIRKLRPDIIIDITGELSSISLFSFTRVRKVYGRCTDSLKLFYDKNVLKEERPTLPERIFDVTRLIYSDAMIDNYQVKTPINYTIKKICIHPFAGWKAKEWNFSKFIKIAEYLSEKYDCMILAEPERIDNDLKNYLSRTNILLKETGSLTELIEVIKQCDLFLSNDSGPVYLASELGKKTFIIHGPTNPNFSAPKLPHVSTIFKKIKCSPLEGKQYCYTNAGRNGCPSFECMNQLNVQEVLDGVFSLIDKEY